MVQASIDNTPISIVLGNGETTTVPTDEVWKISATVTLGTRLLINNTSVVDDYNGSGEPNAENVELVVTGGDKLESNTSNTEFGIHIGGFKV